MNFNKLFTIIIFFLFVIMPLCFFNFERDSLSLIDNRKLTDFPALNDKNFSAKCSDYIDDRIGFRNEMITAYTVLNDKLFNIMEHPNYSYGKEGYVFGAGLTTSNEYGEFDIAFIDMVEAIQNYCEDRDVQFLFVFNPAKPAIYQDMIAEGVNYNRDRISMFFEELDKRKINYLDNTLTLSNLREKGIEGFNKKFDAGHWNYTGAFYGTKAILEKLNENCDDIYINRYEDFETYEYLQETLLVSKFPIKEYITVLKNKNESIDLSGKYSEIELDNNYRTFGYYLNNDSKVKNTPKILMFQGSYMNGYGYVMMQNAFKEYIHVHDYENVIDFPYYYNIFKPNCVVFEVAEYTLNSNYFNYENMLNIDYNPVLSSFDKTEVSEISLSQSEIQVEKGEMLTKIIWKTNETFQYVWLKLDDEYEMRKINNGYELTITNEVYDSFKNIIKVYVK